MRPAEPLPRVAYVEIPDSRTLIPQYQPVELLGPLREFLARTAG